jgi:energy-coupling factor transporter transmembrane protein EcfT
MTWSPSDSWLSQIHPLTKAYILLFVLLFLSFFSKVEVLLILTAFVVMLIPLSGISLRLFSRISGKYVIGILPAVVVLAVLEKGLTASAVPLAMITYLRFLNVIIAGTIFSLTTNPSDISLLLFDSKYLRPLGIAFAAALSSLSIMRIKIANTVKLQRIRGVSLNPLRRGFLEDFESVTIPVILQSIKLSHHYTDALTARGYHENQEIDLPPRLKMDLEDGIILILGTLIPLLALYPEIIQSTL